MSAAADPFAALDPARYALPQADLARLLSPALVIDLDALRENLRRMLAYTGSPARWRPHVKTTKTPAVFAELLAVGLRHFKCATLREARCLLESARASGGAEIDLLLAHPLVGPALAQLGRLAGEHPRARLSVLCEDAELVPRVPAAVSIFVDVDPGMGRTGIPMSERGAILALVRAAGDRFRGLHHYEGHLHGELVERRAQCFACYRELLALVAELERAGLAVHELVTSGTPAFLHALAFPAFRSRVHRVSPGTVVFHDLRSAEENPDLELVPAALVLARVVSRPRADVVTCDAGSKSIAAEAGDPCACVLGHPELVADAERGTSAAARDVRPRARARRRAHARPAPRLPDREPRRRGRVDRGRARARDRAGQRAGARRVGRRLTLTTCCRRAAAARRRTSAGGSRSGPGGSCCGPGS